MKNSNEPMDLEELKSEFAEWRKSKVHATSAIPVILWKRAAQCCKQHSIDQVSEELGISRGKLSEHLGGKLPKAKRLKSPKENKFITVSINDGDALPPARAQGMIAEWTRVDGAKLRLEGLSAVEMKSAVSSFLGSPL